VNNIFRQGISAATLFQLVADLSWLFIAGVLVTASSEATRIPLGTFGLAVHTGRHVALNIAFACTRAGTA